MVKVIFDKRFFQVTKSGFSSLTMKEGEFYLYFKNDAATDFEFVSNGPKGRIKKSVKFRLVQRNIFNLSFSDIDEMGILVDDTIATNNDDTIKVINTLARIVTEFANRYQEKIILIIGSTMSRTRLYQIHINKNLCLITEVFEILGQTDNGFEVFRKGKNYDGFLVKKKSCSCIICKFEYENKEKANR